MKTRDRRSSDPVAVAPEPHIQEIGPKWTQSTLTVQQREQLIMEHLPQVKLIARRIHERIPVSISLDDLVSAGVVGLIAAIDRYDSAHEVKLKTYAEYKIRGAILDSLRGLDWAPRQQRRRSRMIEAAIDALEQRNQRVPEDDEIADFLNLSLAEYYEWLSEAKGLTLGSLEVASEEEGSTDLLRFVADDGEQWPSEILERAELERAIAQAIERMPKIERTVLSLYYYEEMTLRDISKVLGLHESRISQLKTQAILRLRAFVQKRWAHHRG